MQGNVRNIRADCLPGRTGRHLLVCILLMLGAFPSGAFAVYHSNCFDCHIMHDPKHSSAAIPSATRTLSFPNDIRICTVENNGSGISVVTYDVRKLSPKPPRPKSTLIKNSCAGCHGKVATGLVVLVNSKRTSPFTRHPFDVILPKDSGTSGIGMPKGNDGQDDPSLCSPECTAPERATCLSCHTVHTRRKIAKWDTHSPLVKESGCLGCHTAKQ
ncbi:MAG TPA: hypothetical protein VF790_11915 [Dissulfurispiraceae bacterium]